MAKKEFDTGCDRIVGQFIDRNDWTALDVFLSIESALDKIGMDDEHKNRDEVMNEISGNWGTAFALGFVAGHSFDLTYPEFQEDIEAIKRTIQEEALFKFWPRTSKLTKETAAVEIPSAPGEKEAA